jgi:CzcA family heavy metal efflux pump
VANRDRSRQPRKACIGNDSVLQRIVEFSIRRRGVVLALSAALLISGLRSAMDAKLDVFPDFVQPQAVIQTEAPGLSPEQVEALVTRPVEAAVGGITNLEALRSQSIQGLSIVSVVFADKTDIFVARQLLTERLGAVIDQLPRGVKPPRLTPLTSATMDLLKIGLVSDKRTLMEIRSFADWILRPRLQAVPGVAQVGIMGGDVRQLQIQVDPEMLLAHHLSINEVVDAARQSTGALGAGFIETANQRITIQTEGQSPTARQLGDVVLNRGPGGILRLKDVANVCEAAAPKFGDTLIQGRPGVLVKILSQYGSNTMEVTRGVEAALSEMKGLFETEQITTFPRMHRPATFIETAIHHVRFALLLGGALVALVLLFFLYNIRTAFISIIAIPLSLLAAIMVLQWLGYTLNTITLGGLAIATGEVVDDAIIDVENIYRRMRENLHVHRPLPFLDVILNASLEVRSAVVYATFVVVLVFVPVLTMTGLQGRMFAPLGVAYILAILASLVVALTVTPALCALLLPAKISAARVNRVQEWLHSVYAGLLHRVIAYRAMIITAGVAMCVGAVILVHNFGGEFLPEFREGHFVVQVIAAPGTSLPEMMRLGRQISRDFLEKVKIDGQPVIETVAQQSGRAELGEDPWGPHRCEFHVELKPDVPGEEQAEVQDQIREILAGYPGISSEVLTFLGDRISETISGEVSPVVISIFGENLDILDSTARGIAAQVSIIKGAKDVRVASPPGSPLLLVSLRPERLQQYGFQPMEVLSAIQSAYQGVTVAQTYEGNKVFDVTVILRPDLQADPERIGDLLIKNHAAQYVALSQLADLNNQTGRYMILHDGARRRQAVTCNVDGRDINSFVDEVKDRVGKIQLPQDTYVVFGGAAEAGEKARGEIFVHSGLVGLAVLVLLASVFHNIPNLLMVLLNLPFAFVGGVLAVYLTGGNLSIGSIVGFVTLFGITMRNSMMMISHYEHLVNVEGQTWGIETAIRGATERLLPILMTALVTALGLLPIALGSGEVGREIEGPLAIVILGGLISSTLLNLLLLPALAVRFGRFSNASSPA